MLTDDYFKAMGELAILEIFEFLKVSMELRKMNLHTEEFKFANIAMLMDLAMQFGIDIRKFYCEMK